MSFDFPTFNQMLREGRLKDAVGYVSRNNMELDRNVQISLALARQAHADEPDRLNGINRGLTGSEQARRLAALKAAGRI